MAPPWPRRDPPPRSGFNALWPDGTRQPSGGAEAGPSDGAGAGPAAHARCGEPRGKGSAARSGLGCGGGAHHPRTRVQGDERRDRPAALRRLLRPREAGHWPELGLGGPHTTRGGKRGRENGVGEDRMRASSTQTVAERRRRVAGGAGWVRGERCGVGVGARSGSPVAR